MPNPLLNNKSLENFAKTLDIGAEDKNKILEKIPALDEEERENLLRVLIDIYFINEKQEQIKVFLAAWRKFIKDPSEANFQDLKKIKKQTV